MDAAAIIGGVTPTVSKTAPSVSACLGESVCLSAANATCRTRLW